MNEKKMFGADMRCIERTANTLGPVSDEEEILHVDNCTCEQKPKPLPSLASFSLEMGRVLLPPTKGKR